MTTPRNPQRPSARPAARRGASERPAHAARRPEARPAHAARPAASRSRAPRAAAPRAAAPRAAAPRSAAPAPKKSASGKVFAALMLVLVVVLVGVGVSSLMGGNNASSSANASTGAPVVVSDTPSAPQAASSTSAGQQKKTANGNTAVGHVRTAEERKATSDSANDVTPVPKTVYLTFDDGPSTNTHNILRILDEYGVKATWFVKGNQPQVEYVKDIWGAGNQVAIHTYTHDYTGVYASTDAYWNDLQKASDVIEGHLGFAPTLVRFPGGSHNSYNSAISDTLLSQMASRHYHYFDWNISSGDGGDHEADFIVSYILDPKENDGQNALGCHSVCLLMHDSAAKDTTVEALPRLIEAFIDEGFEFDVLLADSYGYHF